MLSPIDPSFGHWLAGFIDGEGCFHLSRSSKKRLDGLISYRFSFVIGTRDDDQPILEHIQQTTGLGRIHNIDPGKYESNQRPGAKPQCRWQIGDKAGCRALCDILDEYPLRSKKASDYAIWRLAVRDWMTLSWDEIGDLAAQLKENRKYREPVAA